jgi:hypothetical protein
MFATVVVPRFMCYAPLRDRGGVAAIFLYDLPGTYPINRRAEITAISPDKSGHYNQTRDDARDEAGHLWQSPVLHQT